MRSGRMQIVQDSKIVVTGATGWLGMATLEPENGIVPMTVANVPGVQISGLIFDAG